MSRPAKPIEEARAFGRLVELHRKPGDKLKSVFERVRRLDPKRWGSTRSMFRLWGRYRADLLEGQLSLNSRREGQAFRDRRDNCPAGRQMDATPAPPYHPLETGRLGPWLRQQMPLVPLLPLLTRWR